MKRVLIVSYYFPPSGGPGVQRALKFARYLPESGWTPEVLTVRPDAAAYPVLDPSLGNELPPEIVVHRTRAWDPYAAYARWVGRDRADSIGVGFAHESTPGRREAVARWVRANLFLPDARVGWVPFARAAASKRIAQGGIDVILTTGPPHSSHAVGRAMKRKFGIPWLADFRDPWTGLSYYEQLPFTRAAAALDGRMEARVLRLADRVMTVSPAIARRLESQTPAPVEIIPNGFDAEDFDGIEPVRAPGWTLLHPGTLTAGQNPDGCWQALASLVATGEMKDLRIRLIGRVDAAVHESLASAGLTDRVDALAYVPHREAIGHMLGADALLLSIPQVQDAAGILTGKVFEYIGSGRPVIGVGPPAGDAAALLKESGAGVMFESDDVEGIIQWFRSQRSDAEKGTPTASGSGSASASEPASRYTRQQQAAQLANLLTSMTDSG